MNSKTILGISLAAIFAVSMAITSAIAGGGPVEDVFTVMETLQLDDDLKPGDFILVADITPFISTAGHVALRAPCDPVDDEDLVVVAGVAPGVAPVPLDFVAPLSGDETCLYHADLGPGITDVALINLGEDDIGFEDMGHTITVTLQGTTPEV